MTEVANQKLANRSLYVLLDGRSSETEFAQLVGHLVEVGVPLIQLRDKRLSDRDLLRRSRLLREILEGSDTLFIMNDRVDLAVLANADGVHVGQDDVPVQDARAIIGPARLVGVSTHSIEQARAAALDGADYIGVGPVFPSGTKAFDEFPGVELLRQVAAEIELPAFAIGGIYRDNLTQVKAAGLTRVAVSSAIVDAPNPREAASAILAEL